jgi:hypothetical protein
MWRNVFFVDLKLSIGIIFVTFYKYTNISTATLVLENKSLRWSSPLIFNDIEECQFTPFTKEQHESAHKTYIKMLVECAKGCLIYKIDQFSDITKHIIQAMRISIKQGTFNINESSQMMLNISTSPETDYRDIINTAFIKCFRVLCLTNTYDNSTMWAYYADQHYGCVFELESIFSHRPQLLREGFVRYHENLKPRSNPIDMLLYGETEEVRDLMIRDVAFSKRTSWNHENEYRFMFSESFGEITTKLDLRTKDKDIIVKHQSDELFTDVAISKRAVKSIIFGVRTTDKDIDKILNVLSDNDYQCNVFKMKMKDGYLIKEELDKCHIKCN